MQGSVAGVTSDTAGAIGASNLQFTGQQAVADLADRISGFQSPQAAFGAVQSIAGSFSGGTGSEGAQNRAAFSSAFGG